MNDNDARKLEIFFKGCFPYYFFLLLTLELKNQIIPSVYLLK